MTASPLVLAAAVAAFAGVYVAMPRIERYFRRRAYDARVKRILRADRDRLFRDLKAHEHEVADIPAERLLRQFDGRANDGQGV